MGKKVIILCGGKGTRIRDLSNGPKPMIKIGEKPIVQHIMERYAAFGHTEFILLLGYKGYQFKDYFVNYMRNTQSFTLDNSTGEIQYYGDSSIGSWKITFAETGLDSMTGSRIKQVEELIPKGEEFFITYGDGLSDVNIAEALNFHKSHGKILTLTGVTPSGRFGELISEESGLISSFQEKPKGIQTRINGGYFVANTDLFEYIKIDSDEIFEDNPMKRLVGAQELMQYNHDGFWQPMDTYKEYEMLSKMWNSNKAPWKI
ncbi:glucose-1-phosphate cytidylyltransferase [Schleiferiaceae bacterium]|nr:glucose-1-phosphate cytidylyltransferase [Schleiferiaceae bacterium]